MNSSQRLSDSAKQLLRKTPFYHALLKRRYVNEVKVWKQQGCVGHIPHLLKQNTLTEYAERYHLRVLVETGTFYGAMVEAMRNSFDQIYSIELDPYLADRARKKFKSDRHIEIRQGDSGKVLSDIVEKLDQKALFWLDAHYSAGVTARGTIDTPILQELDIILSSRLKGHVIIIDDARNFGTDPAYPTIQELNLFLSSRGRSDLETAIKWDSIRITPHSS
ncbi:hypothetical protein ANRL1_01700 [Anaerolineae bacterium]|nr:hypothetical protein ANRL1_01700 [Anaerolineae bacterium]